MAFQAPEYEDAFHRLVEGEIDALIDRDPVLSRINRVRIPGPVGVQAGEGPVRETESVAAEIQAGGEAVLDGDAGVLREMIAAAAEQYISAVKGMLYSQMPQLNVEGQPVSWDSILDYWEREEWSADAAGAVEPPAVIMHPDTAARIGDMTLEQRGRYEGLKARKRAELDARRRGRRIS